MSDVKIKDTKYVKYIMVFITVEILEGEETDTKYALGSI